MSGVICDLRNALRLALTHGIARGLSAWRFYRWLRERDSEPLPF